MQSLLFPAFDFVAKSRVAQIILGLCFFYFFVKSRDAMRDRHTRARVERRIEKQSRKVQTRIERELDEKSAQVADARASAPRGITAADGVSDEFAGLIFSD